MRRFVVTVCHGNLPARATGSGSPKRCHVLVIEMRMAPDFQVAIGICDRLVVRDAEDADIGDCGETAADENAVGQCRVVVAWQDHDGTARIGEQFCGALKNGPRDAVVVESVAGEEYDIGVGSAGDGQHGSEASKPFAMLGGGGRVIDVQV